MLSGKFNYHKLMFTLEVLESNEEKIAFINHIREQISKTIVSFESQKPMSLRMYADETIHLEDNCPELQTFIQEMIKKYSPQIPDRRSPSNEQLKSLVKKEVQEYHKLDSILEYYLESIKKDVGVSTLDDEASLLKNALNKIESDSGFKTITIKNQTDKTTENTEPAPIVNITSSLESDKSSFIDSKDKNLTTDQENSKSNNYEKEIPTKIISVDRKKATTKKNSDDNIIKDT